MKGEFLVLIGTPVFSSVASLIFFGVYMIVIYRATQHTKEQLKKHGELPLHDE